MRKINLLIVLCILLAFMFLTIKQNGDVDERTLDTQGSQQKQVPQDELADEIIATGVDSSCIVRVEGLIYQSGPKDQACELVVKDTVVLDNSCGLSPKKDDDLLDEKSMEVVLEHRIADVVHEITSEDLPMSEDVLAEFVFCVGVHNNGVIRSDGSDKIDYDKEDFQCSGLAMITVEDENDKSFSDMYHGLVYALAPLSHKLACDSAWVKVTRWSNSPGEIGQQKFGVLWVGEDGQGYYRSVYVNNLWSFISLY